MIAKRLRKLRTLTACLAVFIALPVALAQVEPAPDADRSSSSQQITRWIDQLSDSDFGMREQATQMLREAGTDAVDPLLAVVSNSPEPETVSRIFSIFREHVDSPNSALATKVLTGMRGLEAQAKTQGNSQIANKAKTLADRPSQFFLDRRAIIKRDQENRVNRVDFHSRWIGTASDLSMLRRLPFLETVDFENCRSFSLANDMLKHVGNLPGIKTVYAGLDKSRSPSSASNRKQMIIETGCDRLKHLKSCPDLTYLSLIRRKHLNQTAFDYLAELTALTHLGLDETNTNDEQLAKLSRLTNLTTLWLNGSNVSDEGLAVVAKFEKLERLVISETKIRGEGLVHLKNLKHLDNLSLTGLKNMDPVHLLPIASIKSLRSLGLANTDLGDEHIEALKDMKGLEKLWLTKTKITDESVEILISLTGLQELHLDKTHLSKESLAKLSKELPKCNVKIVEPPRPRR